MASITKKLKMFGSVTKHVLCHIERLQSDEIYVSRIEVMEYTHKFANLKNAAIIVHKVLLLSFH